MQQEGPVHMTHHSQAKQTILRTMFALSSVTLFSQHPRAIYHHLVSLPGLHWEASQCMKMCLATKVSFGCQ